MGTGGPKGRGHVHCERRAHARLATVPLQACTPRRPAVHCRMTSTEGSLVDAVPQPTNDVLSDDVPAGELIKPREVVINRCYGGYHLSSATIKLLMSRHGLKGEVWDDDDPYHGANLDSTLSRHDPRLV